MELHSKSKSFRVKEIQNGQISVGGVRKRKQERAYFSFQFHLLSVSPHYNFSIVCNIQNTALGILYRLTSFDLHSGSLKQRFLSCFNNKETDSRRLNNLPKTASIRWSKSYSSGLSHPRSILFHHVTQTLYGGHMKPSDKYASQRPLSYSLTPRFAHKKLFLQDVPIEILTLKVEKCQYFFGVNQMTSKKGTCDMGIVFRVGACNVQNRKSRITETPRALRGINTCFTNFIFPRDKLELIQGKPYIYHCFIPQLQNLSHDIVIYLLINTLLSFFTRP